MKNNTSNKPNQNTMKPITALLSLGLLLLLSNCGSNWDLLRQAEETEEQLAEKETGFTQRQQTPEGAELIFTYEVGNGLQAHYQTSTMPRPQAVSEYPVLQDAAGSPMRMSKLEQEEAYLLTTAGKWEVSETGVLRYHGLRGRGGMIPGGYPGSGASAAASDAESPVSPASPSEKSPAKKYDTGYKLESPTYEELQIVQAQYMRCPVDGYQLGSVQKIITPNRKRIYEGRLSELTERDEDDDFSPSWLSTEAERTFRQPVQDRLMQYVTSAGLSASEESVKELWVWHGTKSGVVEKIIKKGYENFRKTDDGYYGSGIYFTLQAQYAHNMYSDDGGHLLLNKICFYSAYPVVTRSDMKQIRNRANLPGYDANYIPVSFLPKDASNPLPDTYDYYPAEGLAPTYDEIVIFQVAQTLPVYWVNLQPGLPRELSPSLAIQAWVGDQSGASTDVLARLKTLQEQFESFQALYSAREAASEQAQAALSSELQTQTASLRSELKAQSALSSELHTQTAFLRSELKAQSALSSELHTQTAFLRSELKAQSALSSELHTQTGSLRSELKSQQGASEQAQSALSSELHTQTGSLRSELKAQSALTSELQAIQQTHVSAATIQALIKEQMELAEQERKREKEKEKEKRLQDLKTLLGANYLGEQAWGKLGITVSMKDLPEVADALIKRIKAMQTKGEQPILMLDLGKSIGELEEKFKSKGKTLLNTSESYSKPENLRAESCYKERGTGKRWLLLPGSDHGVLPGSRYKSYADQVKHMKEHYPGYEVGGARELLTLYMLHHMETGLYLFPEKEPSTWGRCKETYQVGGWKGRRMILGDSGLGGLVVNPGVLYAFSGHALFGFLSVSS